MANKRDIKKQIRFVCGEVAFNCMLAEECFNDVDSQKMYEIIMKVAALQHHSTENLSFSFEKTPRDFDNRAEYNKAAREYYKAAYKSFVEEFNKKLQDIVKEMNALLSPAQREINKQAAQKN